MHYSALLQAYLQGEETLLQLLLSMGIGDPSPLISACAKGDLSAVQRLLDGDSTTEDGMRVAAEGVGPSESEITPLLFACLGGHDAIVECLLRSGANPNTSAMNGGTALQIACTVQTEAIVDKLLHAGADVEALPIAGGRMALRIACRKGNQRIVAKLLGDEDIINQVETGRSSALRAACDLQGKDAIVVRLLQAGISTNGVAGIQEELTALQAACKNGKHLVVELLIAAGANVNANESAALQVACENGHDSIVERLLAAGVNVNERGALRAACKNGHDSIVERLLAAGANVKSGALHAARGNGHDSIVERLLAAGVDVNTPTMNGKTTLEYARQHKHDTIAQQLLAAGANE